MIANGRVYAVCLTRTDTAKDGERIISVHKTETGAKKEADRLNTIARQDEYNVYMFVVHIKALFE